MGFFESESFEAAAPSSTRSSAATATRQARTTTSARGPTPAARQSGGATSPASRVPAGGGAARGAGAAAPPTSSGGASAPGRTTPPARGGTSSAAGGASAGTGSALSSLASVASRIPSYAQQAWDFGQTSAQAVQAAQQFAGTLGIGGAPAGQPPVSMPAVPGQPMAAPEPAMPQPEMPQPMQPGVMEPPAMQAPPMQPPAMQPQTFGYGGYGQPSPYINQLAQLLQALGQRQIPQLPGAAPQPALAPALMAAGVPGSPPQTDALGLLRIILTNPQLQQALRPRVGAVQALPRAVQIPIATPSAPQQIRQQSIPLGAVLNAIVALAGQSMTELNESVGEEEPDLPSYLIGDDGSFIVDPASAEDRAALVTHLFRISEEVQRQPGRLGEAEADAELDESDQWALEAGF